MVDDSYFDIKVYKCWVCGNRLYVDYPKRLGSLACFRCGDPVDVRSGQGHCASCLKVLGLKRDPVKARACRETNRMGGRSFSRKKEPPQLFLFERSATGMPVANV